MVVAPVLVAAGAQPPDREPDPRLELGRSAGVEHHVVHAPVVGDHREAALGDDEEDGAVGAGGAQQPAQVARVGQLLAPVDEDHVGVGSLEEGAALGGQDLDLVTEQRERREHLRARLEGAGEQQQRAHAVTSSPAVGRSAAVEPVETRCVRISGMEQRTTTTSPAVRHRRSRSATGPPRGPRPVSAPTTLPVTGPLTLTDVVRRAVALHPDTRLPERARGLLGARRRPAGGHPPARRRPGRPRPVRGVPPALRGRLISRAARTGARAGVISPGPAARAAASAMSVWIRAFAGVGTPYRRPRRAISPLR